MNERPPIGPADFFSDSAAREAGLTDEFWFRAYTLYMEEVSSARSASFDWHEIEWTVRVPFGQGHTDVLVRSQPEPGEEGILRLTAFAAAGGDEVRQLSRLYWLDEDRSILGEALLPNAGMRW